MKRTLRAASLRAVCLLVVVTCGTVAFCGQEAKEPNALQKLVNGAPQQEGNPVPHIPAVEDPLRGWAAFRGWENILKLLGVLTTATVLAALIAYHPSSYGKATSLSELEQPKTFILYALVGAIVAVLADVNDVLGFIVFGIGGLLRFRTDVGAAKDTGRVILVTVVGLACGFEYFALAVISTLYGWMLILFLEARPAFKITVKGLVTQDGERQENRVEPSLKAYRSVLEKLDCNVIRERRNFIKGQFTFVFRAPRGLGPEDFEEHTRQEVPEELRGGVDWAST